MWPDRRIQDLFGIPLPIVQAPMAGPNLAELAIGAMQAGALGSLPCAMLGVEQALAQCRQVREATAAPLNLNFFCHRPPEPDPAREAAWRDRLAGYYREYGLDPAMPLTPSGRAPFDEAYCELVEQVRPQVVSFHFGLPAAPLLERVRAAGARVISSATTVAEARWLEANGCDAIVAQGAEAGGHRGVFLYDGPLQDGVSTQLGLLALLPQVVDAVRVPVIAAGGIGDARGIVAAFALGAAAVQLGTAYLFCPEAKLSPMHRQALREARDDGTALTNLFTGRPARGIVNRLMRELGPMSPLAPEFPLAGGALAPLRAQAEAAGGADFTPLWSGQAARLGRDLSAYALTRSLAEESLAMLARAAG